MVNKSWENIFVGREEELKALREALQKSAPSLFGDYKSLPEPQIVILKGEPGVGKSRIVQEFYRRIAVTPDEGGLDPDDYWPDSFGDSAKSGTELVNPVIEGGHTLKKTPPFIWWGVKWNAPFSGRDADRPQLGGQDNLEHLIAHKAGIKRRIENVVKVAKAGLKMAVSQVPFFGWLDAGHLFDVTDAVGSATNVKRATRNITKGHDAALSMQEQGDDQLSKVKQYLQNIIHPPGLGKIPGLGEIRDAGTPLILWLDDAQWMLPDEVRLIQELFNPASRVNWPLLVVATYWSSDWNRHTMDSGSTKETVVSKHLRFSDFVNSINKESVSKIEIEEKLDFAELLRVALPGLTTKQHKLLIEKTHSHPLVFRVVVTTLLEDKFSFVDNEVSGGLTQDTEEELEGLVNNEVMKFFFDKKLQHLDAVTKRVLKWSSCQGNRFLQQINNSIGEGLEINGEEIDEAIQIAINPEAIVQRIGTKNQNEFRQSIYRNLVLETFRTAGEKRKINDIIKMNIGLLLQDERKLRNLSKSEYEDLHAMADVHLHPMNRDGQKDIYAFDATNLSHQIWLKTKLWILDIAVVDDRSDKAFVANEIALLFLQCSYCGSKQQKLSDLQLNWLPPKECKSNCVGKKYSLVCSSCIDKVSDESSRIDLKFDIELISFADIANILNALENHGHDLDLQHDLVALTREILKGIEIEDTGMDIGNLYLKFSVIERTFDDINNARAIEDGKMALAIFRNLEKNEEEENVLLMIADAYATLGQIVHESTGFTHFPEYCKHAFLKSLEYCEKVASRCEPTPHLANVMSYACGYLVWIYSDLNKFDEAKKYSNMNFDNLELAYTRYKTPALTQSFVLFLCSSATENLYSLQETRTSCLKAINIAEDSINTHGESYALSDNLGHALSVTGNFFFHNSEYEPARDMSLRYQAHCVNRIQQYGKSLNNLKNLSDCKLLLFKIESQLECIDEAKSYCFNSIELIEECLANYSDELEFCGNLWMRKGLYSDLSDCYYWLIESDESDNQTTMRSVLPKYHGVTQRLIELEEDVDCGYLYEQLAWIYKCSGMLDVSTSNQSKIKPLLVDGLAIDFVDSENQTEVACVNGILSMDRAIELDGEDPERLDYLGDNFHVLGIIRIDICNERLEITPEACMHNLEYSAIDMLENAIKVTERAVELYGEDELMRARIDVCTQQLETRFNVTVESDYSQTQMNDNLSNYITFRDSLKKEM